MATTMIALMVGISRPGHRHIQNCSGSVRAGGSSFTKRRNIWVSAIAWGSSASGLLMVPSNTTTGEHENVDG